MSININVFDLYPIFLLVEELLGIIYEHFRTVRLPQKVLMSIVKCTGIKKLMTHTM